MSDPIPFSEAFVERHPFGWLAAVHLPPAMDASAAPALAALVPEEAAFARTLRGRRQVEWAGGRMALRIAAAAAGRRLPAILPAPGGGPAVPSPLQASISHKRRLAVALVAPGGPPVGIDLEELDPPRPAIASRVLRAEELAAVDALPPPARWQAVVSRFAVKEAIYKALHPHVRRYVAFSEASVSLEPPAATLQLAQGEGPFAVEVELRTRERFVLAAARIALRSGASVLK